MSFIQQQAAKKLVVPKIKVKVPPPKIAVKIRPHVPEIEVKNNQMSSENSKALEASKIKVTKPKINVDFAAQLAKKVNASINLATRTGSSSAPAKHGNPIENSDSPVKKAVVAKPKINVKINLAKKQPNAASC